MVLDVLGGWSGVDGDFSLGHSKSAILVGHWMEMHNRQFKVGTGMEV